MQIVEEEKEANVSLERAVIVNDLFDEEKQERDAELLRKVHESQYPHMRNINLDDPFYFPRMSSYTTSNNA